MKLLDQLQEEDFAVLRKPLESGRQGPNNLGAILLLAACLQVLTFIVTYVVVADQSYYPFKKYIFSIHLIITIVLIIFSIMYSFSKIYKKREKTQYLVTILVSQNLFGVFAYLFTIFILGSVDTTTASMLTATIVTLILGILIFVFTCVRFYKLLRAGHYKEGSKKGEIRARFEKKSFMPLAIFGGLGAVYLIQFLSKNFYFIHIDYIFIGILCLAIFYTMLFVLPEQLVILYCKKRFESFNFDKDGNLKPMGSEREDD
ncbi:MULTISPECIES: hypothetical protein [Virgibacillus]|uniref:ABC transporter ATPase n=1 Tax=Virgibacillus dokdonensis TaxID=302167 RepID=A0A2K9J4P2_9BACI|nr:MULTISPECIES: hypothetical protein [Virgibacillus]AUJ26909.1 hypothetical protein A21D_03875 [Virgibacillus dokdonensis]NWO13242.1 hypothetical protein [Virgibacillus sp.]